MGVNKLKSVTEILIKKSSAKMVLGLVLIVKNVIVKSCTLILFVGVGFVGFLGLRKVCVVFEKCTPTSFKKPIDLKSSS